MNICMNDVMSKELQLNSLVESKLFNQNTEIPDKYNYSRYLELIQNESISFPIKMNLFLEVCDNEPRYRINTATNILCEEVRNQIAKEIVPSTKKVRNGHATDNMNRHKIGTAVKAEITKAKQAATKTSGAPKSSAPANNSQEATKEEMILSCLDKIYNTLTESEAVYTIIKNHKNLSKRFNINQYIKENSNDIKDCIFSLCTLIDTYDIPYGVKYKVALENIQYGMFKNAINCDSRAILETVTDYFLLSPEVLTESHLNDLVKVASITNGYDKSELESLKNFLTESEDNKNTKTDLADFMLEELDLQYMYQNEFVKNVLNENSDNKDKKNGKIEIEKLINDFKKLPKKTPDALRSLIYKIYTKDADDIINETPNLLGCVRFLVILGSFSIGLIPGIIVLIADYAIKLTLSRKQIKRLIDKYKKEIEKCEKKISKLKDEKAIERVETYKDSLEKAVDKFEDYQYDLGDDEPEDDDDFDLDDVDESSYLLSSLNDLITIEEGINSLNEMENGYIDMAIANCANKIDTDCISAFTTIASKKSSIIDPTNLKKVYNSTLKELRSNNTKDYFKIDTLNSSIYDLEHIEKKKEEDCKCCSVKEAISDIDLIHDIIEVVDMSNIEYVTELSITNSLKLASENLKRGMKGLSDKEKIMSRNIDSSVNNVMKSAENALRKGNREAVIKGQMLPSASKTIKTAILTGAAWLVNPAIAVIGLLGAIASSKKVQANERQLILDEIETELTVVDKQLKMAEDKDDVKAMRNLLTIQRNLQRQRQRLMYKMKVDWGQNSQTKTSDLGRTTTTLKNGK